MMDDRKPKEGMSVREIEEFAKKHQYEVFFCLLFLLASIFGLFGYFRPSWHILLTMGGGIVGVIFPNQVDQFLKKIFHSIFQQNRTVLIIFGSVGIIFAIFIPVVVFLIMGLFGGRAMYRMALEVSSPPK